jgi:hypothetical protein
VVPLADRTNGMTISVMRYCHRLGSRERLALGFVQATVFSVFTCRAHPRRMKSPGALGSDRGVADVEDLQLRQWRPLRKTRTAHPMSEKMSGPSTSTTAARERMVRSLSLQQWAVFQHVSENGGAHAQALPT